MLDRQNIISNTEAHKLHAYNNKNKKGKISGPHDERRRIRYFTNNHLRKTQETLKRRVSRLYNLK